jgi:cell division protein FtsZ
LSAEIRRVAPPVETPTLRHPTPVSAPPTQGQRKVLFDDVDVPDFLKNGS